MPDARLSPLDASFLEVEGPSAHMHVGWVSTFAPPAEGPAPDFATLRDHIASRMGRAPRYRQRLATVPLGLAPPEWVDDDRFSIDRHVHRAPAGPLSDLVDQVMSRPLPRDRPLWEMHIAHGLPDGRIGLVGKAHHCMVDGLAAVELGMLLLDPDPQPPPAEPDHWAPAPAPGAFPLTVRALAATARDRAGIVPKIAQTLTSPSRLAGVPRALAHTVGSLSRAALPLAPGSALNVPSSPQRRLVPLARPLDDLRTVKRRFGTTVNDVMLAIVTGGLRRFAEFEGSSPQCLKAMVPVSVRADGEGTDLGNRIAFMFVPLPCDEPDPVLRLLAINRETGTRKREGEPAEAERALGALALAPALVQRAIAHLVSGPRAFNLVVSNIPGPALPMYLCGCELEAAYPVVPLAGRHALSVGMTTINGTACFGLYADSEALPAVDRLAPYIEAELDALLALSEAERPEVREPALV